MSDSSGQERTERASPKRRQDARKKGQVPRSRELSAAVMMAAAVAVLLGAGGDLIEGAAQWLHSALSLSPQLLAEPQRLPQRFGELLAGALWLVVPLLAACFFAALASPLLIGGWNFSAGSLAPDFQRLSPLKGLGRMFSSHAAGELGKSLAKVFLLGGIAAVCARGALPQLLALSSAPAASGMAAGAAICLNTLLWLCGGLLLIAALDVPLQLWSYAKQLRMTRQELREEYKQAEGRPEVKAKIRRMQQDQANRRMMEKVPKADVILTNPTHYAVALQYSPGRMRAPRVVAKGADLVAQRIRELAREHRIPIVAAPPLARALYRGAELEQEIPVALYAAVAQVLSYVYQLRAYRGGQPPQPPVPQEVPGGEEDAPPGSP